jgi:hypothetical protein
MPELNHLILPGHPLFEATLQSTLPPGWRQFAHSNPEFGFVARAGSGILEAVSYKDLEEYIEGGEYDERLEEMGDEDVTDDYG